MGRGWRGKVRRELRNAKWKAVRSNERVASAAGSCSGNDGDGLRQAGAAADAAAAAPVGGQERSARRAEGGATRDETAGAALDNRANTASALSGEIRLLRRAEVTTKNGGPLARSRAGQQSADDRSKCRTMGNSAAQRVDVAKLIKDDLQAYTLRTSGELLSAFVGGKSSIRQLFSSCQLDTEEPHFHETIVAAVDRVIGDLFFAFRHECLNVVSAFTKSTYFAGLAGSSSTLAALSTQCLCQLVSLLSLAVQEKVMSVEQARCYLKELETAAGEKGYGGSGSSEPADWSAFNCAGLLLNWEEQSLSFEAERERALTYARLSINGGPGGVAQAQQLTEQERESLSRGHRASASLLPSNFELRYGSAPPLCANRLDGQYRDAEEYIDTHFFLLRENFVGPLRKAVQEFVQLSNLAADSEAKPPARLSDARLYGHLTVVSSLPVPGQFVFKVRLSHGLARSWTGDRLLIKGSLVALSADRFETIVLATVVRKDKPEHGSGNLIVDIIRGLALVVRALGRGPSDREAEAAFSMIESATYYEEYRHNAETLQRMERDALPFRHHLIADGTEKRHVTADSESGSAPRDGLSYRTPRYLLPNSLGGQSNLSRFYDFNCLLSSDVDRMVAQRYRSVDVLDSSQWPAPEHMGLDASQAEALKTALCSDLAVIQGPPGTGKTYIGIKIVAMLLANSRAWSHRRPTANPSTRRHSDDVIAVICYTNHALDQFLELILDTHPDSVVRIGGRSTNPRLESCNIKILSPDPLRSRAYRGIKRQLDAVERLIALAETRGGCSMQSLTLKDVSRYLETRHVQQFRRSDDWFRWLDCRDAVNDANGLRCDVCSEHDDANTDDVVEPSAVALCKHLLQKFKAQIDESRRSPLKMTCSEMLAVDDVWKLSVSDRCRMYRYLAELYFQGHSSELEALAEQRNNFRVHLQKLRAMESLSAFRGRKIIGATVTGAIKNSVLINLLKPKVVIVEEAAEILEANILASFTRHCEHLILIGDHQQLRPKPEMYELCVRYNLNVSLFERLVVHRGTTFTQLQIQRRMRPEISKIVRNVFYNAQLQDHTSVEEREPVRGLARNVFFVQHTQRETSDGSTKTFVNEFEARFVVELWRYLQRHGYERRQMTILVPYGGQLRKVKELLGASLHDVRLTTVDNYQGEENDIIILCLVQSSEDGTIGFVGESNRICVALSRARLGFFCFGNFNLLSRKSPKWKAIVNLLTESGEIGPALPLYCHAHGQQTGEARAPDDISSISNGGCSVPCNAILHCGHVCPDSCHYDDPGHQKPHRCQQKCLKTCQRGQHDCGKKCSDVCGPCYQRVPRSFAECDHQWEVRCYAYDIDVCMHPVTKPRLRCGRHEVDSTCHFSRCSDLNCSQPGWLRYAGISEIRGKCYVLKSKPCLAEDVYNYPGCEHQVAVSCHALTCANTIRCTESIFISVDGKKETVLCKKFSRIACPFQVTVTLQCGHSIPAACSERRRLSNIACPANTIKKCDSCGSERKVACGSVWPLADCKGIIEKQLACGHTHKVECGKQNRALICTELVIEQRPICGHKTLERRCCDDAASSIKPCTAPVSRILDCGHSVDVSCSTNREAIVHCNTAIVEKLKCGHVFPRLCRDRQSKPMCPTPVKVERSTCHHHEIVKCHEQHQALPACSQLVEVTLPTCRHSVWKPCSQPIESVLCDRQRSRQLGCGHKKNLKCYEAEEDATCLKMATRRLPCDHAAKVSCHSLSCKTADCSLIIHLAVGGFSEIQGLCHEIRDICSVSKGHKLVLCGHVVDGACSAKQSDLVCSERVLVSLPCGHHVQMYCHARHCKEQGCSRAASDDGKSCAMLKSELSVCAMEAILPLPCGHKVAAACHVARCTVDGCRTTMIWRGEESQCHRLRAAALATECHDKKRVHLPCGHQKIVDCCDVKQCRCDQSDAAIKQNVNSFDDTTVMTSPSESFCRLHACAGYQVRELNCGHTAEVPCRDRLQPVQCREPVVDTVSLCGHSAVRPCGYRKSSNLKCTSERCEMWCWHGGCQKRCAEQCEPCTEPCAYCADEHGSDGASSVCGHRPLALSSRRRHVCFQPCPLARYCSMPCSRSLPCGHDCRGLCGEVCPVLCLACPGPLLERVCRRYGVGPAERFLRLMPCNDVIPVAHMDDVVTSYRQQTDVSNGDTLLTPLLCPTCRSPVGYCKRYDEVLKRYFNLKRKVPAGADGEWIGCARGHVRRREEQHCSACLQLQQRHRTVADPTRRRLLVGAQVRFRCAPGGLPAQFAYRPRDDVIGEVYSVCSDYDDNDDAAELVVNVRGKLVVTVAGNVTACTE